MGYDVQFVQVATPAGTFFPLSEKDAATLLARAIPFDEPGAVRDALLAIEGSRPGPEGAVDYMGTGLNYARFFVDKTAIVVENNCNARELLAILGQLSRSYPTLLIRDLQNGQLHDAASFADWWAGPL